MKTLVAAGAAVVALALAGSANAAVLLFSGNFGGTGVHSVPNQSLASVTGLAGSDVVTLTTTGDLLDTSGNGELIYAVHDGLMDDLLITFTNNYGGVTFNLNIPNHGTTAFNLAVNGGAFNFSQGGLGNGQNKFKLIASGADFIHSLAFTFTGSQVQDIRQIRVSPLGVVINPHDGVPEAATWALMLVGFGGLGAMLRRRRAALA